MDTQELHTIMRLQFKNALPRTVYEAKLHTGDCSVEGLAERTSVGVYRECIANQRLTVEPKEHNYRMSDR